MGYTALEHKVRRSVASVEGDRPGEATTRVCGDVPDASVRDVEVVRVVWSEPEDGLQDDRAIQGRGLGGTDRALARSGEASERDGRSDRGATGRGQAEVAAVGSGEAAGLVEGEAPGCGLASGEHGGSDSETGRFGQGEPAPA